METKTIKNFELEIIENEMSEIIKNSKKLLNSKNLNCNQTYTLFSILNCSSVITRMIKNVYLEEEKRT